MAYRFTLKGNPVECDTVQELLAAHTSEDAHPTTETHRARKMSPKQRKQMKATTAGNVHSWRLAQAYATKKKMSVPQARTYLTKHPRAKRAAERLLASHVES